MLPVAFALRKRQDNTDLDNLPSSIGNPTATLPATIVPSNIVADPSATASVVSAEAPAALTTITETQTLALTSPSPSTVTSVRTRTIIDPLEYASITSAEAASAKTSSSTLPSSTASATSSSTATAAPASSSNLNTLVPAIAVPIIVVLVASLALFWFIMRRRHRRELKDQPEFVMAGKGEKLSSRSNSARSVSSEMRPVEKKSPAVSQKELPSTWKSPSASASEWPSAEIGIARPLTPQGERNVSYNRPMDQSPGGASQSESRSYRNFSGPSPMSRPTTSGRGQPPPSSFSTGPGRSRGNSTSGQRGLPLSSSRSGPSPTQQSGPSPISQGPTSPTRGKPLGLPGVGIAPATAFRLRDPSPSMNQNNRAQAPSRLEAPGAYNGASSISQYSPIVKNAPLAQLSGPTSKRVAPPPLSTTNLSKTSKSSSFASPTGMTEENLRIARFATSSRLAHSPAEPSPSPKLPPPATRSQLIPREMIPRDSPKQIPDNYYTSHDGQDASRKHDHSSRRGSTVSDADDYEDIDAKSDVSSLNEFERFDFGDVSGSRSGSATGNSLNYFAAQNSPASGRGSPFGNTVVHERW